MSAKKTLTILAAMGLVALVAAAPADAAGVDARQHAQRARISTGVRWGRLTPAEAFRLKREQAAIRALEARERRDGGCFTLAERARVQRALGRASRHIARQAHDRQRR